MFIITQNKKLLNVSQVKYLRKLMEIVAGENIDILDFIKEVAKK